MKMKKSKTIARVHTHTHTGEYYDSQIEKRDHINCAGGNYRDFGSYCGGEFWGDFW